MVMLVEQHLELVDESLSLSLSLKIQWNSRWSVVKEQVK